MLDIIYKLGGLTWIIYLLPLLGIVFFIKSDEEKVFMGLPQRFFREVIIIVISTIFLFIIFGLITDVTLDNDQQVQIQEFILNKWLIILFSILFSLFFSITVIEPLRRKIFRNLLTYIDNKNNNIALSIFLIIVFLMLTYLIILSFQVGKTINLILAIYIDYLNLKVSSTFEAVIYIPKFNIWFFILLIFLMFMYYTLYFIIKKLFSYIMTTKIKATISLNNGETYKNMYIINPNVDNSLLIGDTPYSPYKHLIPKQNIHKIELRTVDIFFEQERRWKKKKDVEIILPPFDDYNYK